MFKPMLACSPEHGIDFPSFASFKIDGVRCVVRNGIALSRSLKPIRNRYVQQVLGRPQFEGFDGELVVGAPNDKNVMQNTTSGVMAFDGQPDFTFLVFDCVSDSVFKLPFHERLLALQERVENIDTDVVRILTQIEVHDQEQLDALEAEALSSGYEGLIVRAKSGRYKFGRSTPKEKLLLKIKRFEDGEGTVEACHELLHNENAAFVGELGQTKRSNHLENKVASGVLGAITIREISTGEVFNVGTGFTWEQRQELWAKRENLRGKILKYKCFRQTGTKEAPRHPVFLGWRDSDDM